MAQGPQIFELTREKGNVTRLLTLGSLYSAYQTEKAHNLKWMRTLNLDMASSKSSREYSKTTMKLKWQGRSKISSRCGSWSIDSRAYSPLDSRPLPITFIPRSWNNQWDGKNTCIASNGVWERVRLWEKERELENLKSSEMMNMNYLVSRTLRFV